MSGEISENSNFDPIDDGELPTNPPLLDLPNESSNSANISKGGEAEQNIAYLESASKKMDDTAVAVMPSKLSASDGTVGQTETPKTCNAKGKTSELNISEEKRRSLKSNFDNTQRTTKAVIPFLPPLQISEPEGNDQWTCECGFEWGGKRKRCKCGKWRGGKRERFVRKKKIINDAEVPGAEKPNQQPMQPNNQPMVIDVPIDLGNISPVTGVGASIETFDTAETVATGNETIAKLLLEDADECGDGGDSDEEGEGFFILGDLNDSRIISHRDRTLHDTNEIEENVLAVEENCIMSTVNVSDEESCNNDEIGTADSFGGVECNLQNAPNGWKPPGPPEGWKHTLKPGEPEFSTIDNPGNWSSYTYKAKIQKSSYINHSMPAGAIPVKLDAATGKRMSGGYEFFYNGWQHPSPTAINTREGATRDNLFPKERECKLDASLLKKMGLTRERLESDDALFFFQLLCPFVDPSKSGIPGDPRMPYYTTVSSSSNLYAYNKKGWGSDYGSSYLPCTAEELVVWDGIVIRNKSTVGNCWDLSSENAYDPIVDKSMSFRRWLDIKAVMKQNVWYEEKKRGEIGYDPTQKYRLIWDVLIFNMNNYIESAGLDVTIDETTWANSSYADVHSRIRNKPGASKGGQHTVVLDSKRRFIYAYTPRHKFFQKEKPFTAEGPAEVKRLVEIMKLLVKGASKERSDNC